MTTTRRFRSRGPHWTVLIWGTCGLAVVAVSIVATVVGEIDGAGVFGLIIGMPMAVWFLWSSAYSWWGAVEVERRGDIITVTHSLGRWARRVELASSEVAAVDRVEPSTYGLMPGGAGPQLRVARERSGDRPVTVAGGLCLKDEELEELAALLRTSE